MRTFKRTNSVVGLELDAGTISAVELDGDKVTRKGTSQLAAGFFADGEVVDAAGLSAALKGFFSEHGLGTRVRVGLANQRVAVRTLALPPMLDDKELEAAVRFQAAEQIPMPLDQAVLDFQRVDGVRAGEKGPEMLVVAAAARRDSIERLLGVLRAAGLQPIGIDIAAFGLIRALHDPRDTADDAAVLYCHFGDATNLAIGQGSTCLFTRVLGTGIESMAQRLAERRKLTLDHARGWLSHVGLEAVADEIDGDPEIVAEARSVLEDGAGKLAGELRHSMEFHASQAEVPPVTRAVACGSGSSIPGFLAAIATDIGLDVESTTPSALKGLPVGDAARLALSYGLAREV